MYPLTFSYFSPTSPGIVNLLDGEGNVIGSPTITNEFHRNNWHCYLLSLDNGFQGFVEFATEAESLAIFAINPQEFETNPVEGAGDIPITFKVRQMSGAVVEAAAVYVTSDLEGTLVVAGRKYTNANGDVTFRLNHGTYYIWREHNSFTFSNPRTITV